MCARGSSVGRTRPPGRGGKYRVFSFRFPWPAGAPAEGTAGAAAAHTTISFKPHKRRHPLWDADAPVLKTFSAGPPNVRALCVRNAMADAHINSLAFGTAVIFFSSRGKKKKKIKHNISRNVVHVYVKSITTAVFTRERFSRSGCVKISLLYIIQCIYY